MEGKLANTIKSEFSSEDLKLIKSYNFLTLKPFIYALNIAQEDLANAEALKKEFEQIRIELIQNYIITTGLIKSAGLSFIK